MSLKVECRWIFNKIYFFSNLCHSLAHLQYNFAERRTSARMVSAPDSITPSMSAMPWPIVRASKTASFWNTCRLARATFSPSSRQWRKTVCLTLPITVIGRTRRTTLMRSRIVWSCSSLWNGEHRAVIMLKNARHPHPFRRMKKKSREAQNKFHF